MLRDHVRNDKREHRYPQLDWHNSISDLICKNQPRALQNAIDNEVQQMLQRGVVQPSFSPWSSPVVMVKKKDGSWRFCVDYRSSNTPGCISTP